MWPIFFQKSLILGDIKRNVGICTLWSKKEFFAEKLNNNDYCLIGNLYTTDGINYLLKNILANPVINRLVVCGKDFFQSGDALINFFKNGVDQNRKIIGSNAYLHSNIPREAVEAVRRNVQVVDLRNKEDDLLKAVENLPSSAGKPFADPLILSDEIETQDFLTSSVIGFRVEGGLSDIWLKILDLSMKFGEIKASEHELKQREILDVTAVISEFSLQPFLGLKKEDVEKYISLFFSETSSREIEYTYGKRLMRFAFEYVSEQFGIELRFFVNQIDKVVERLKRSPHSRRAVAGLWNPFIDADSENPPCLTQITWNVKNGKLYQTCIFRSHDLFGAYLLNALALRKLQEKVSSEVGIPLGDLIIISQSAHAYENSWHKIEKLLNDNYRNNEGAFIEDRAGYFRIEVDQERREIIVRHYLTDGRKSNYEFRGHEAASLYKKTLNENLVSQMAHAAYLGRELTRAEECLKNNREYVQEAS